MKVIVSSASRFWAFRLAEQIDRRDSLETFFTQDFKRSTDRIRKGKIRSLLRLKLLRFYELACFLIPFPGRLNMLIGSYKARIHDRFVADYVRRSTQIDIFVGWNGCCRKSLEAAKEKEIITVVECGSTHPRFRQNLLNEEYKRIFGRKEECNIERIADSLRELEMADYVAIPSNFVKKTFLENGFNEKKLIIIPYGVNLEQFRKIEKKDDVFRIIWCGTVCIRKGIHYLLQAFHELDINDAELWLLGGIEAEMQPFIEKYKSAKVKFFGPKRQGELYKYYSQGSIFVHPSIEEGLSMVQLEAMSCGLPVICTMNTGGEDIITEGKDGFVVPIRNVSALKEKIKNMYDNPSKRQVMSNNAIKKAKMFTWDIYGEKVNIMYRHIIVDKI